MDDCRPPDRSVKISISPEVDKLDAASIPDNTSELPCVAYRTVRSIGLNTNPARRRHDARRHQFPARSHPQDAVSRILCDCNTPCGESRCRKLSGFTRSPARSHSGTAARLAAFIFRPANIPRIARLIVHSVVSAESKNKDFVVARADPVALFEQRLRGSRILRA